MERKNLASLLSHRRRELNLLQREVAERCHVVPEMISQLESGKRLPGPELLVGLAAALELSLLELYDHWLQQRAPGLHAALAGS